MLPCRTVDPELFPTMTDPIIDSMALVRLGDASSRRVPPPRAAAHSPGGQA
ncbi:MAG: hypothetical protein ACRDRP_14610 [Pseudonocardiaceae bacterium]